MVSPSNLSTLISGSLALIVAVDHISSYLKIKPNCTLQLLIQFIEGGLKSLKANGKDSNSIDQLEPLIEKLIEEILAKKTQDSKEIQEKIINE